MYYKRSFAVPNILGGIMENVVNANHLNDEMKMFSVPVNILETEKSYELHVVAPGLKKEDFKLGIEKNILTISFEHKDENKDQKDAKWIRSEYRIRSFKRSFTLNEKVDANAISAKYADGVLVIALPKKENAAPETQEIPVN